MNDFSNVAVGDRIHVFGRRSYYVTEVTKVNRLDFQCADGVRYLKRYGTVRGAGAWNATVASPDTEQARARSVQAARVAQYEALVRRLRVLPTPPPSYAVSDEDRAKFEAWLDAYPFAKPESSHEP